MHLFSQNQNSTNKSRKAEGSVKLSKMGVLWLGKNKNQDNEIVEEIKKLEKEKFSLENRVCYILLDNIRCVIIIVNFRCLN
jgi:hypothetical protein